MGRTSSKASKIKNGGGTPSVVNMLSAGSTYDRSSGAEVIQLSAADRDNKSLTDQLRATGFQVNGHLATRTGGTVKASSKTASAIGKMTVENRQKYLDEAPVGTRIKGIYDKEDGHEYRVEKKEAYSMTNSLTGRVGRRKKTYWTFDGYEEKYPARAIRTAFDGTSKYYTTSRRKK